MKRSIFEIFAGSVLFIVSYFLAIYLQYSQFYTILLFGIFFILKGAYHLRKKREFINFKEFLVLYLTFFVSGIIIDLVIGIWLAKLWYYPAYTLINYFNLYLIIYPLGGFVMIYSFALIEAIFVHRPKPSKIAHEHSIKISLILSALAFVSFILSLIIIIEFKGFFAITFFLIFSIALLNYFTLRIKKSNMLERLHIKTFKYGVLILSVAYIQGVIHEWPNIYAREWIYQNMPLSEVTFLGIPVLILFFGWLFLLVVPYTIFEFIMVFLRRKDNLK